MPTIYGVTLRLLSDSCSYYQANHFLLGFASPHPKTKAKGPAALTF